MRERIFIRHGESRYNAHLTKDLDSELTEKGKEQARSAGIFLRENIPNISEFVGITSPYWRCLQTAHIIGEETGLTFTVDAGPREIMVTYQECAVPCRRELFPHHSWCYEHSHFCNETELEYLERVKKYVSGFSNEKLLVVSHGSPVGTMYDLSLGLEATLDIKNFVSNASISYVRGTEGVFFGKIPYAIP